MQLTLHATRPTPHSASRLVHAMPAWPEKTRRAPSRHCRVARVYGHTATAGHAIEYTPHPPWEKFETCHFRECNSQAETNLWEQLGDFFFLSHRFHRVRPPKGMVSEKIGPVIRPVRCLRCVISSPVLEGITVHAVCESSHRFEVPTPYEYCILQQRRLASPVADAVLATCFRLFYLSLWM